MEPNDNGWVGVVRKNPPFAAGGGAPWNCAVSSKGMEEPKSWKEGSAGAVVEDEEKPAWRSKKAAESMECSMEEADAGVGRMSLGYWNAGKELPAAIPSDPRYQSPPPTPPPAISSFSGGGAESSMALLDHLSLSLFFIHTPPLSICSESAERPTSYRWRREKQTEREFFVITGRMM
jgi:hypothetical protein